MSNDRLFIIRAGALSDFFKRQLECTGELRKAFSYPPTDLDCIDPETFQVKMALAGYSQDQLAIEVKGSILTVSAKLPQGEAEEHPFFVRGIAKRSFSRSFEFPQLIEVDKATFVDGLLVIQVKVVIPESQKPRSVPINA